MKLVIQSGELGSPTIPVRWCLDKADIDRLTQNQVTEPYLLLVVINHGRLMERQLIPLEQMLTYVSFTRPGQNDIMVSIVWHHGGAKHVKKEYYNIPNADLLEHDGETWVLRAGYGVTGKSMYVDRKFFAPEPPEWERWWVNLWFSNSTRDQCHFRKRRLLAYSIQPILVFLWLAFSIPYRFLAAVFYSCVLCQRKVNWKAVRQPFTSDTDDVWDQAEGPGSSNFVWEDKNGKERPWYIQVLVPPLHILLFIIFCLLNYKAFDFDRPLGEVALFTILSPYIYGIFFHRPLKWAALKILASSDSENRKAESAAAQDEEKRKKREAAKQKVNAEWLVRRKQLEGEYRTLACQGPVTAKLDALPREKQTLRLRFLDLKAKVCKPYAR